MENKVQVFQNEEFGRVRTLTVNDEIMFVGKDVADILGYQNGSRDINRHVEEEDRRKIMLFDGSQNKETIIINESGLYSLVLTSKKPNAKKFKRWVTSEVLPSIRKHGLYAADELLNNLDVLIAVAKELKAEREKTKALTEKAIIQDRQITEMQPKVNYYDLVLNCKDLIAISVIAKDYGKSAAWMNNYLHEKGVQFKRGNTWLLYKKYAREGYASTKTLFYLDSGDKKHTKIHTYWTQKGRLFIYELLKQDGILPLIEQEIA